MNYLSDAQYVAAKYPGPCTYSGDANKVKPRILAVKMGPAGAKKSWKPVKSNKPDCASYEAAKSKDYVGKSPFMHKFAMPKELGVKVDKETFTTATIRRKKFVPGVGAYTPKLDYVAVPYSRKRL